MSSRTEAAAVEVRGNKQLKHTVSRFHSHIKTAGASDGCIRRTDTLLPGAILRVQPRKTAGW